MDICQDTGHHYIKFNDSIALCERCGNKLVVVKEKKAKQSDITFVSCGHYHGCSCTHWYYPRYTVTSGTTWTVTNGSSSSATTNALTSGTVTF